MPEHHCQQPLKALPRQLLLDQFRVSVPPW